MSSFISEFLKKNFGAVQLSDNQEEIEIRAAQSIIDHLLALLDQLNDLIVSVTFIRDGTSQKSAFWPMTEFGDIILIMFCCCDIYNSQF